MLGYSLRDGFLAVVFFRSLAAAMDGCSGAGGLGELFSINAAVDRLQSGCSASGHLPGPPFPWPFPVLFRGNLRPSSLRSHYDKSQQQQQPTYHDILLSPSLPAHSLLHLQFDRLLLTPTT
ncbi:uncharacterized protein EV422DRAFT_302678 [Fimicolochytrium jonesii]|uniref:uncharacterized protein n=1 Tax=Fimicolochytrium jonesii TaxID=1396493 RepID=UPI0022FE2014|nr:uncharacterized protein EV422DRAFT_302678 [Fimicolochytrium jonesii]KAI8823996.1 hypothetical protein EV422DRAFT_302678 [Fimicolochytrium jonesii]